MSRSDFKETAKGHVAPAPPAEVRGGMSTGGEASGRPKDQNDRQALRHGARPMVLWN